MRTARANEGGGSSFSFSGSPFTPFSLTAPGRVALYACDVAGFGDRFVSTRMDCEGMRPAGQIGYARREAEPGLVPLVRFYREVSGIVSGIVACLDGPPADNGAEKAGGSVATHAVYNIGNNRSEELIRVVGLLEAETGRTAGRVPSCGVALRVVTDDLLVSLGCNTRVTEITDDHDCSATITVSGARQLG